MCSKILDTRSNFRLSGRSMKANYKKLGYYIQQVDVRNTDLKVSRLLGLSIEKCFIEIVVKKK